MMFHRPHMSRREAQKIAFVVLVLAGVIEVFCCYQFLSQRHVVEVLTIVSVWAKDHARRVIRAIIQIEEE